MIHATGRIVHCLADNPGRDAGNRNLWGNIFKDNAARPDTGSLPNFNIAENFCPGPDENALAHLWVAIAADLAGSPEGDLVQEGNMVLNDSRFADNNTGRVIEENTGPDAGCGVDINGEDLGNNAL